jgi:hypothetical protein
MTTNTKNKELLDIAKEIRDIVSKKQEELSLTFVEDTHTYHIMDKDGNMTTNFPSVSTVIKQFYLDFPELEKSLDMVDGDIFKQDELLQAWRATSDYANNQGSRVHYFLEMDLLKMYGSYKEVRKPIFECDEEQTRIGNEMIDAGHNFIRLMHRRGAVLLDTEMVLGSNELEYTGQPDKVWLIFDSGGVLGFIITDWKTNKPKNMEVQSYTEQMLPPFEDYHDTALTHYKIQLPLYARLLLNMLKGTKYGDIKFFGAIIVHLLEGKKFVEYRIEKSFIDKVLTMEPLPRIDEVLSDKKKYALNEQIRVQKLDEAKYIRDNEL